MGEKERGDAKAKRWTRKEIFEWRWQRQRRRHFARRGNGAVLSRLSSRDSACDKASLLLPSALLSYPSPPSLTPFSPLPPKLPFRRALPSLRRHHHPRPLLTRSLFFSPHSSPSPFIPRCHLTLFCLARVAASATLKNFRLACRHKCMHMYPPLHV